MIACILLPYFAAILARRERRLPEGVPLILRSGEKVAACCESAAGKSVVIGMPIRETKWRCPGAEVIPINYQTIRQEMGSIVQILSQFTHLIEIEHLPAKLKPRTTPFPDVRQSAVFYVDLGRLAVLEATKLTQEMGRVLREEGKFYGACGLATAKFPAYAAAAGVPVGNLRTVPLGQEAAFLAPRSITLLPMPDEGRRRLLKRGITTIGAFAAMRLASAAAYCGKDGVALHQLARGIDSRRLVPAALQVVERVTRELEGPISDREAMGKLLRSMATELSLRLQLSGSVGKTLVLQLLLDGQEAVQYKTTLRQPVSSSRYLSEALLRLLARAKVNTGICGLVVTLADLIPFAGQQLELFAEQPKPREELLRELSDLLTLSDAPTCHWITALDPDAGEIEQRYERELIKAA